MMRLIGSFSSLVVVGLIAVFGWQSYQQFRKPVDLRFVVTSWPTAHLVSAVAARGFFTTHRLNVKIINVGDDYDAALRAVQDGQADGGIFPLSDPLLLTLQNVPMRIVLGVDYSAGADGIVAASEVKQFSDLKGRRVAYQEGSYGDFLLREGLRRAGLTMNDVTGVPQNNQDVVQSFLQGKVDAAATFQPFLDQALRRSGSTLLFSSEALPGLLPDVIAFRKDVVSSKRPAITSFLSAWFDGINELNKESKPRREMLAVVAISNGTTIANVENSLTTIKLFNFMDNAIAFTYANDLLSLYRSSQEFMNFHGGFSEESINRVISEVIDPSFVRSGLRESATGSRLCLSDQTCP
ncbi:MAG: ABC transporter substrate-binding protein [Patescibacteria group bacterium]|jgi:NitT/TauT family transport system substrate-binding protein